MATYSTYGAWAPTGSTNRRARLRFEWDLPSTSAGQTSVQVTLRVYVEAGYSFADSSNSLSWSGALGSGSTSVPLNVPTGGAQLVRTLTSVEAMGSSPRTISASVSLSGVEYIGATITHSDSLSIPASASTPPSAPASVSTVRIGTAGTAFEVSWSSVAGATSYTLGVQRESTGGDAPFLTTSDTRYQDTMPGDDQYRYWVMANNAAGSSGRTYGPYVRTLPAPPRITWSREGAEVVVRVEETARYPMGSRLQWRPEGGAWVGLYISPTPGAFAFRHTPPMGQRVQYRADTRVTQPSEVSSVWSVTPVISVLAPPLAPILTAPLGVTAAASTIRLAWDHRPVDGSAQSAAEVRYRQQGSSGAWTTATATTGTSRDLAIGVGLWEWQARTKGAHAGWGPWSAVSGFRVAVRPSVTITAPPAGAYPSNRITPAFTYSDPAGAAITAWEIILTGPGGAEVSRSSGQGSYTPAQLPAVLTNATSYALSVRALSGVGLWSDPATRTITTAFTPPATPILTGRWVEEMGVVELTATAGTGGGGTPATVTLAIEGSYDGVTWFAVGSGAGPTVTATDRTPPLCSEPRYRAVATSTLSTDATSTVLTIGTPTRLVWLTGMDGATAYLRLDIALSSTHGHEVVLADYEGQAQPTPHFGVKRAEQAQISGVVVAPYGSPREVWLQLLGQEVWYRDPSGLRWRAVLTDAGISSKPTAVSMAISATVVRTYTR